MSPLAGKQRKVLRGLAHDHKPLVQVGKSGVTDAVLDSLDDALEHHELVKVRFLEHKDEKKALSAEMAKRLTADLAGMIGHVAIFYRPARDPDRRRIVLPS